MIGRSIIIFQKGNNQNEIHEVNSWEFALSAREKDLEAKIIEEAKKKKWVPEDVVSDEEVKKIVFARSLIPGDQGYHKWASDGVSVINLSGDPNLYNPAKELAEQREQEHKRRQKAFEDLKQYLPDLAALRKKVPTGRINLNVTVSFTLQVVYTETNDICVVNALDEKGKSIDYASWLVSRESIRNIPEFQAVATCPHRAAYLNKCEELAKLFGLNRSDVENEVFSIINGWKS